MTTPQEAAAEVAERAGTMASMMHQRVVGVIENMSYLPCPHCTAEGKDHRLEVFGSGGGERVAATLSQRFGYDVPLLGRIPLDIALREGGDAGKPIVEADPTVARRRGAARRSPTGSTAAAAGWPACSSASPRATSLTGTRTRTGGGGSVRHRARRAGRHRVRRGPGLRTRQAARAGPPGRPVHAASSAAFATNARDELRAELGPDYADLELRDLDPRAIVRKHIDEALADEDDDERGRRSRRAPAAAPLEAGERTAVRRRRDLSRREACSIGARLGGGERRRTAPAPSDGRRPRRARRSPAPTRRRVPSWRLPSRWCSRQRSPASAIRRSAEPRPSLVSGDQATSGTERTEAPSTLVTASG